MSHPWLRRVIHALVVSQLFVPGHREAVALGDTEVTTTDGIGVGGDVNDSTLNVYNRDPRDAESLQMLGRLLNRSDGDRRAAEAKAADLAPRPDLSNVTTQAVVGFLRVLARQPDLGPEEVPAKMAEITANYVTMQERSASVSPQDPAAADLVRQARGAGEAG